jgi:uncharacterized protein YciI
MVDGRLFAYFLDNVSRATAAARSAHVRYIRSLGIRGVLILGGPFRDGRGAVVCVIADDEDAADAIARADPLVAFGFTLYQLREIDAVERELYAAVQLG